VRVGRERIRSQIDEPIFQFLRSPREELRWDLGLLEEHPVKARRERVQRNRRLNDVREHVVEAVCSAARRATERR
jgi:hypothetical protein